MQKLRNHSRLVILIAALTINTTVVSAEDSASLIYQASGIASQVNSFPATIISSLHYAQAHEQAGKVISKDDLREISSMVNKSFDEELARGVALNLIHENLSAADQKNIITWLQSPLGKKITQIEEMLGTDQDMEAMDQFLASMKKKPPTAEYHKAIAQLTKAMYSQEITGDLAIGVMKMTLSCMLAASGTLTEESFQERVASIDEQRESFILSSSAQIQEFILFTYRGLNQDELQKYVAFNTSASGMQYNKAVYDVLSTILARSSDRFIQSLYVWSANR